MTNRVENSPADDEEICCAALMTPQGRGAVAVISVQGPQATLIVERCFQAAAQKPLSQFPCNRIVFGRFDTGDGPSEELVVCRRDCDRVEIQCHGGRAAAESIFRTLSALGCRRIDGEEMVAALRGDPLSDAAHVALASARTQRTAAILLDQHRGALRRALQAILSLLQSEQLDAAAEQLRQLDRYADIGIHLTRPWKIVLTGRPNVGKSSLINALLGYQRSIVYDQPGTTRDVLTAPAALDGWPVELSDTAGLRGSDDEVEAEGVALAREKIQRADAVVLVFDAGQPWSEQDATLQAEYPHALILHNKSDLVADSTLQRPPGIAACALDGRGLEELMAALVARLVPATPPPATAVPFTQQQVEAIHTALAALRYGDGQTAISRLREIAPPVDA